MVSADLSQLKNLFGSRCDERELHLNFERRFRAVLSKFNSLRSSLASFDALAALLLSTNATLHSSQRITVLAAATVTAARIETLWCLS